MRIMVKNRTLYDKIWDSHLIQSENDTSLIYIDRHLVHEVTSPQAFEGLRIQNRKVRRPELTLAVPDHNVPTTDRSKGINDTESKIQVDTLRNTIDEWIAADGTRRRVHEKDKRKQKGKTPMESYREMWEDSLLEKKELDPRAIAKIAKMTDSNNHNAAVITLSKHMKEKKEKTEKLKKL